MRDEWGGSERDAGLEEIYDNKSDALRALLSFLSKDMS